MGWIQADEFTLFICQNPHFSGIRFDSNRKNAIDCMYPFDIWNNFFEFNSLHILIISLPSWHFVSLKFPSIICVFMPNLISDFLGGDICSGFFLSSFLTILLNWHFLYSWTCYDFTMHVLLKSPAKKMSLIRTRNQGSASYPDQYKHCSASK